MIHISKFKVRKLNILYGILSRKIKTNKTKLSVPLGKKKMLLPPTRYHLVTMVLKDHLERVSVGTFHNV